MSKISNKDIHYLARHSNWSEQGIDHALKKHVNSDSKGWKTFLNLFLLSLGVGFTVAGIVFFFAYNWADLDKSIKLGLVEGLVFITVLAALLLRKHSLMKKIVLTGSAILVGVLFAVFGQIYQTGANAYDFFLGWTIFVSLWVLVANFPPLWLIYMALINTTLVLYAEQVAHDWSELFLLNLLFVFNAIVLGGFLWLGHQFKNISVPGWFTQVLALALLTFSTMGIVIGMFEAIETSFIVLFILAFITYAFGIWYGITSRNLFYLSAIPFSIIIIFSAFLIKVSDGASMFFTVGLFVIASVTGVIKMLIDFSKKKAHAE